jgi:prophage antirepressor-like protein
VSIEEMRWGEGFVVQAGNDTHAWRFAKNDLGPLRGPKSALMGTPRRWAINLKGVSDVIRRSRHPLAEQINDWMYDEVLPHLLRDGYYKVGEGPLAELRSTLEELQRQYDKTREENWWLRIHTDARLSDLIDGK